MPPWTTGSRVLFLMVSAGKAVEGTVGFLKEAERRL
jgi:hypothetical protein